MIGRGKEEMKEREKRGIEMGREEVDKSNVKNRFEDS